jgi:uncharacterized protein (TIGR00730 family)
MRSLCVFCGSSFGTRPVHGEAARRLGAILAARKIELIFGGGHIGLMGVLADAVLAGGGRAVGVIPRALVERELAHTGLTELHVVETMHQRKALMADRADAFVALPGGYGTCDELFEILTWAQLHIHAKPIGLLNTAGYFDSLLTWLDHLVAEGFLRSLHRDLLLVADESDLLLDRLAAWQFAAAVDKFVDRAIR